MKDQPTRLPVNIRSGNDVVSPTGATSTTSHRGFALPGWTLFLSAVLLLAGCAGPRVDWTHRVGNYTFDQAVVELGPPDKDAKLQDGTVVADWMTRRGYSYSYPSYGGGALFWYGGPPYPTYTETSPDFFLRLTFGPDGQLKSWKKFTR